MFIFSKQKGGGLLACICLLLCFQVHAQKDSTVVVRDFNGDGYIDVLLTYYDGGGSFGGKFCELKEGKKGTIYELDTWSSFATLHEVTLMPLTLQKKKCRAFLNTVKEALLPPVSSQPDPSLSWIIQAHLSKKDSFSSGPYSHTFSYTPTWIPGKLEVPDVYYITIKGDTLRKMYFPPLEAPEWYDPKSSTGWLVYYAHNHNRREVMEMGTRDSVSLKSTAHGIFLNKEDGYQWLFITDGFLTKGPEKLRWPSINKAVFFKDLVIVEQALAPHMVVNYYVIDPANGKCGQIDTEYLWDPYVKNIEMEISEGMFRVRWDGDEGKVYSYEALREGL